MIIQKKSRRGAALVAVFWIMAIMGLAIVALMRIVSYQVDVVSSQTSGIEARQQAEKGLAIAANPVVEKWDPLMNQDFGDGTGFNVKITSEGKYFDINYILSKGDKSLLRQIFEYWGLESDQQSEISDALLDWWDPGDTTELNGAEFEDYEDMGIYNQPYNRPFYSLDEMRLVRGMDIVESIQPRWREWFTTYSNSGLDVAAASDEFLAIAAEEDIEDAYDATQGIPGADGIRDTEDDVTLTRQDFLDQMGIIGDDQATIGDRFSDQGSTDRIESVGFSGNVRRKLVLIIKNRSGNPTILDRREEFVQ
ncbi:type II secretion system protein GspK [Akkermansiaceae bacterium]|nr:type II secretion system protein GspK [Akkermansiaceae bacterium]MDB4532639.1 type II secretion system protein GspK [bacterium]